MMPDASNSAVVSQVQSPTHQRNQFPSSSQQFFIPQQAGSYPPQPQFHPHTGPHYQSRPHNVPYPPQEPVAASASQHYAMQVRLDREQRQQEFPHRTEKRPSENDFPVEVQREPVRRRILSSSSQLENGDVVTGGERIGTSQLFSSNGRQNQSHPIVSVFSADDGRYVGRAVAETNTDQAQSSPMWIVQNQTSQTVALGVPVMHQVALQDPKGLVECEGNGDIHTSTGTPHQRMRMNREYIGNNITEREVASGNAQHLAGAGAQTRWTASPLNERSSHLQRFQGNFAGRIDSDHAPVTLPSADDPHARETLSTPDATSGHPRGTSNDIPESIYNEMPGESSGDRKRRLARERQRRRRSKLKQSVETGDNAQSRPPNAPTIHADRVSPSSYGTGNSGTVNVNSGSKLHTFGTQHDVRSPNVQDEGLTQERYMGRRQSDILPVSHEDVQPRFRADNGLVNPPTPHLLQPQNSEPGAYIAEPRPSNLMQSYSTDQVHRISGNNIPSAYRMQPQILVDSQRATPQFGSTYAHHSMYSSAIPTAQDVASPGMIAEASEAANSRRESVEVLDGNLTHSNMQHGSLRTSASHKDVATSHGNIASNNGDLAGSPLAADGRYSLNQMASQEISASGGTRGAEQVPKSRPTSAQVNNLPARNGDTEVVAESVEERRRRLARQRQRKRRERLRGSDGGGSSSVVGADKNGDISFEESEAERVESGSSRGPHDTPSVSKSLRANEQKRGIRESGTNKSRTMEGSLQPNALRRSLRGRHGRIETGSGMENNLNEQRTRSNAQQIEQRREGNGTGASVSDKRVRKRNFDSDRFSQGTQSQRCGDPTAQHDTDLNRSGAGDGEMENCNDAGAEKWISWRAGFDSEVKAREAVEVAVDQFQNYLASHLSETQRRYVLQQSIVQLGLKDASLRRAFGTLGLR